MFSSVKKLFSSSSVVDNDDDEQINETETDSTVLRLTHELDETVETEKMDSKYDNEGNVNTNKDPSGDRPRDVVNNKIYIDPSGGKPRETSKETIYNNNYNNIYGSSSPSGVEETPPPSPRGFKTPSLGNPGTGVPGFGHLHIGDGSIFLILRSS